MEETETPHPDYVKGFNEGYILSKHMPQLADKMPKDLAGERGQGFVHGRQEFLQEKSKDRTPAWLKTDRLSNLDKSAGSEKEKDADSPDRS